MYKRQLPFGILSALGATVALAPAIAQTIQQAAPVTLGSTIEGSLDPTEDATTSRGNTYDSYRLSLQTGQMIEIVVTGEVEPFIAVGRQTPAGFVALRSNGGTGQARLIFEAQSQGEYEIRTIGNRRGVGVYTMEIREAANAPPPQPVDIAIGATQRGSLTEGGVRTQLGFLYHDYLLSAAPGARFAVSMNSSEFSPHIELGSYHGERAFNIEAIGEGDGERARVIAAIPDSGVYVVRARGLGSLDFGNYTLAVEALPSPGPEPRPIRLRPGVETSGTLTMADAMVPSEDEFGLQAQSFSPYDFYSISGRAGETYAITMRSEDFDTLLQVGANTPAGYAVITENDDGFDEGTDSQLSVTFQRDGELTVRATVLYEGDTGAYTIVAAPGDVIPNQDRQRGVAGFLGRLFGREGEQ